MREEERKVESAVEREEKMEGKREEKRGGERWNGNGGGEEGKMEEVISREKERERKRGGEMVREIKGWSRVAGMLFTIILPLTSLPPPRPFIFLSTLPFNSTHFCIIILL